MEYNFREIEQKWQEAWKEKEAYKVINESDKKSFYVLDMFPYPSGTGLHVGHPLGYIASDIYSRFKRLKGFNVLHPMGFDSFGLPAEQYAIETGQHPAETTKKNIATFKSQLDKIGFSYDWSREVQTSDPNYYRWTQWIFLQLFNSYFCNTEKKAKPVSALIKKYEENGAMPANGDPIPGKHFTADQWKSFSKKEQEDILMNRRLAFSSYGEVNWCEALGTVLANDEVVNGLSERGGHPVVKKKMRQWYLRITAYADRLLDGLEQVDFSESMKEMQRNWIGKSEGAEMEFRLTPNPSPAGEGNKTAIQTANKNAWPILKDLSRENRKTNTIAEDILWQRLRGSQLLAKVRRQHVIDHFIIDFAFLNERLLIEVDGGYHKDEEQKKYDDARSAYLIESGYKVIRFTNSDIVNDIDAVIVRITQELAAHAPLSSGRGVGGEAKIKVYTTRPDTIFGVDFIVLAPEHELVNKITTDEQHKSIDEYLTYVKSRSDRERMAEVKQITGCFTGAYALNPFNGKQIPVWIAEYVLIGYGTGAIMAVPCGDQRDFAFARHFNIPITNIIGGHFKGEEANSTKDAVLENSDFLNGIQMKDAIKIVIDKIEELNIGKRKVNYRMRDAGFSRQRYWGEPFPIVWNNGIAIPLDENELPLQLPHVEKYGPGPDGEGPLANITEWTSSPSLLHRVEKGDGKMDGKNEAKGAALVPKYKVGTPIQFEFAKQMRKEFTDAENVLWQRLRANKLGVKFRRQHPIESYIADFICLQHSLIVEADGGYHQTSEQKIYDEERTRLLNEIGFNIIRFSNDEVLNETEKVIDKIEASLKTSTRRGEKEGENTTQNERKDFLGKDQPFKANIKSDEVSHPSPLAEQGQGVRETSTMPGYAGSSWYFLRYMDPSNNQTFCDRKASDYWGQVDVYIGGTEHAVGHLLYSRMWTKVLYDLGLIGFDEPFKKLVNQGMIQGSSRFVYRFNPIDYSTVKHEFGKGFISDNEDENFPILISYDIYEEYLSGKIGKDDLLELINKNGRVSFTPVDENRFEILLNNIHIDVNKVDGVEIGIEELKKMKLEFNNAYVVSKMADKYICGVETEKMSKSKYNTVNPDDLVLKYGADTFRMYEMFLGPVEQSKPWDTKGIEGVHRFLRKLWRLFFDDLKGKVWNNDPATEAELKILHRTIKKIEYDTEHFSFNTAVSAFMISVNDLADQKCHKKEVLEQLLILLLPYAPHIAEELWSQLGNAGSILDASYPKFDEGYLVETSKDYPVSVNGKLRTNINIALDAAQADVEKMVLQNEIVQKWLEGKSPKKIIFVKGKMVNIVV